jgi:tRNA(Ile)-lysidine synthase
MRGQRILVAVSGGLDSMVLLHVLHELAPRHGWQLTVAHLNHQLRGPSSDADERLVRRTARRLGLPVRIEQSDVRRIAWTHHLSLEMAAREVRHEFLARTAAQLTIPSIALAHHADDQLELFFLRLFRGSGGEGLSGIRWQNPSPNNRQVELVRPLLDQPKSALLRHAVEAGIRFREDATNACLDIQRNRIRHELLPLLRAKFQPALDKVILRTADIVGAEADFAAEAAVEWLNLQGKGKQAGWQATPGKGARSRGKTNRARLSCPTTSFEKLPVALQRRVVQVQLLSQGIAADYSLIEQLRSSANQRVSIGLGQQEIKGSGPHISLPTRCAANSGNTPTGRLDRSATRQSLSREDADSRGSISVGATPAAVSALRDSAGILRLEVPEQEGFRPDSIGVILSGGAGQTEFGGAVIRWRIEHKQPIDRPHAASGREFFDADKVGSPIRLRHWQPGDRFQPIGMAHPVKLQDFFTNRKVPFGSRRRLIVATTGDGEVFWVEGMRISERFKLSEQTISRLQWRWKRP